jgi:hypothetical protein
MRIKNNKFRIGNKVKIINKMHVYCGTIGKIYFMDQNIAYLRCKHGYEITAGIEYIKKVK